jgi:uncharacterized protein YegL
MSRLMPWSVSFLLVAAAAVGIGALGAGAGVGAAPGQATPVPSPSPTLAGCVAQFTKTVWPDHVALGETVSVTLHARPVCPVRDFPLHVVLVMDGSASMLGSPTRSMKEAARRFVQDLHLGPDKTIEVGVVDYNTGSRTLCQLSTDEAEVLRCVDRVGTVGDAKMDVGMTEGLRVLAQGRRGIDRSSLLEVMIVMSDCQDAAGCDPARQAASQVKGQGVLLATVCISNACDSTCMRQLASSPRYFFLVDAFRTFGPLLEWYWRYVATVPARSLSIDDTLAADMTYVAGSAVPTASRLVTATRSLAWDWRSIDTGLPGEGVTATYRVATTQGGVRPVNLVATGVMTDSRGYVFRWTFPVPEVFVSEPPSPTPRTSPSPAATASPTRPAVTETPGATAAATGTATATPSEAPAGHAAYLPVTLRRAAP